MSDGSFFKNKYLRIQRGIVHEVDEELSGARVRRRGLGVPVYRGHCMHRSPVQYTTACLEPQGAGLRQGELQVRADDGIIHDWLAPLRVFRRCRSDAELHRTCCRAFGGPIYGIFCGKNLWNILRNILWGILEHSVAKSEEHSVKHSVEYSVGRSVEHSRGTFKKANGSI